MPQQTQGMVHGHACHVGLFARHLFVGQRIPLDSLYVVDASFFPSSGAVNPALTILANALRVGERLRERPSS